jgi:hypothetical protein
MSKVKTPKTNGIDIFLQDLLVHVELFHLSMTALVQTWPWRLVGLSISTDFTWKTDEDWKLLKAL